eukprot:1139502-Pelagomonas_calceolata.AAC.5
MKAYNSEMMEINATKWGKLVVRLGQGECECGGDIISKVLLSGQIAPEAAARLARSLYPGITY